MCYDESGRYAAELAHALRDNGTEFRLLHRVYRECRPERDSDQPLILLDRHDSILLLESEVSADGSALRVRLRNRDGSVDVEDRISLPFGSEWSRQIARVVVDATQRLVDTARRNLSEQSERESLLSTVEDALGQVDGSSERVQAEFLRAFVLSDIAWLERDAEATWQVVKWYESILSDVTGLRSEGSVRINLGAAYETLGGWLDRPDLLRKAVVNWKQASVAYERYCVVGKALNLENSRRGVI